MLDKRLQRGRNETVNEVLVGEWEPEIFILLRLLRAFGGRVGRINACNIRRGADYPAVHREDRNGTSLRLLKRDRWSSGGMSGGCHFVEGNLRARRRPSHWKVLERSGSAERG
jgi:hypothetical protein